MSMTSAADARSQAVSPLSILSIPGDCRGRLMASVAAGRAYRCGSVLAAGRVRCREGPFDPSRLTPLHALSQADDVPFGVREHRKLDRAVLDRGHDRLPAGLLDLGERALEVLG